VLTEGCAVGADGLAIVFGTDGDTLDGIWLIDGVELDITEGNVLGADDV